MPRKKSDPIALSIRPARPEDTNAVWQLLQSRRTHLRTEWRPAITWIGTAPAMIAERYYGPVGCLITPADPLPAAWVSAAAVARGESPMPVLRPLFTAVLDSLSAVGITSLSCMPTEPWLQPVLEQLDFVVVEKVATWEKLDLRVTRTGDPDVVVRPATTTDVDQLARIERAAFAPRWRYSPVTLSCAMARANCLTVAARDDTVVGYQLSTTAGDWAHLVRITVDPAAQQSGVGTRLMADALARYETLGVKHVSLNTQSGNIASHRLYTAFGFHEIGLPLSVWERTV